MQKSPIPEHLFHYTSVRALAHILKAASIRFTRLDLLSDRKEGLVQAPIDFKKNYFVSCWTGDPEESIPHWHIYSGAMGGVRIRISGNLTETHLLRLDEIPPFVVKQTNQSNIPDRYIRYPSWIGSESLYQGASIVNPPFCSEEDWPLPVEYVHDGEELAPDIEQKSDRAGYRAFKQRAIGRLKSEKWRFESEWRYRLFAAAAPPNQNDYYPPDEYLFLPIKSETFRSLEITLGPRIDPGDRILVKALVETCCPSATIVESALAPEIQ